LKRALFLILRVAISVALIGFVLFKVGIGNALSQFRYANLPFIGLAALLFLISNLFGAGQWSLLLRVQKIRLPLRHLVSLYFVGVFFNNFMVGNIGGDAVRIYFTSKLTKDTGGAFAGTFSDRFIGLLTLTGFSFLSFFLAPEFEGSSTVFILILCIILGLSFVVALSVSQTVGKPVAKLVAIFGPEKLKSQLKGIRQGLLQYRSQGRLLGRVFILSLGIQILRITVHYVIGLSLGINVPFRYFLIFIPLIAVFSAIPVSFGGLGVREGFGVFLFGRLGVDTSLAFSMELLAYLVCLLASLPGGVIFIFQKLGEKGDGGGKQGAFSCNSSSE